MLHEKLPVKLPGTHPTVRAYASIQSVSFVAYNTIVLTGSPVPCMMRKAILESDHVPSCVIRVAIEGKVRSVVRVGPASLFSNSSYVCETATEFVPCTSINCIADGGRRTGYVRASLESPNAGVIGKARFRMITGNAKDIETVLSRDDIPFA